MTPGCLSIEEKGGDRLASLPNQLLVRADLAFIDLPSAWSVVTIFWPGTAIADGTCA
jgi:hypothetical protein